MNNSSVDEARCNQDDVIDQDVVNAQDGVYTQDDLYIQGSVQSIISCIQSFYRRANVTNDMATVHIARGPAMGVGLPLHKSVTQNTELGSITSLTVMPLTYREWLSAREIQA